MPTPGWLPDKDDSSILRWWDGEAWTSKTRPKDGPLALPPRLPRNENGATTASSSKPALPPRIARATVPEESAGTVSKKIGLDTGSFPALDERASLLSTKTGQSRVIAELPTIVPEPTPEFEPFSPLAHIEDTPALAVEPETELSPPETHLPPPPPVEAAPERLTTKTTPAAARDVGLNFGFMPVDTAENSVSARDVGLHYGFSHPDDEPAGVADQKRHESLPGLPKKRLADEPLPETASAPQVEEVPEEEPFWDKKKQIWILILILIAVLIPAAFYMLKGNIPTGADEAVKGFISSVNSSDDNWQLYATPEAFEEGFIPIVGDVASNELNGMTVQVEVGETTYNNPCGSIGDEAVSGTPAGCSDRAETKLTVKYSIPEQYETLNYMVMYSTRPHYYGDDVPSRGEPDREVTAVGDWSVSRIDATGYNPEKSSFYVSNLIPDLGDQVVNTPCHLIPNIFLSMSLEFRINGALDSSCFVDPEDAVVDESTEGALVSSFPIFNEATLPKQFENKTGVHDDEGNSYFQYEFAGESAAYVFSIVKAENSQNLGDYRVLSIVKKELTLNEGAALNEPQT